MGQTNRFIYHMTRILFSSIVLLAFLLVVIVFRTFLMLDANFSNLREMNTHFKQTNFKVGSGCSGTLINRREGLILTAAHCIMSADKNNFEKGETITIKVSKEHYEGHELKATFTWDTELVALSVEDDLALVKFDGEFFYKNLSRETLVSNYDTPPLGTEVFVVGNPKPSSSLHPFFGLVTKGVLSFTHEKEVKSGREFRYFIVDATVIPGNSGGAAYTEDGRFLGVVSAGHVLSLTGFDYNTSGHNLIVPYYVVIEFLERYDPTFL